MSIDEEFDLLVAPLRWESPKRFGYYESPKDKALAECLCGFDAQSHYRDIENDLNYKDYSDEERHRHRAEYQAELIELCQELMAVDEYGVALSADATSAIDTEPLTLVNQLVYYTNPTIIKRPEGWRGCACLYRSGAT